MHNSCYICVIYLCTALIPHEHIFQSQALMMMIQQSRTSFSQLMKKCQYWKEMTTHREWKKLTKTLSSLFCFLNFSFCKLYCVFK